MILPDKIKKAVETHSAFSGLASHKANWNGLTRTHFNHAARIINKQISKEVLANPDLAEMFLIIGKQKLEQEMKTLRCNNLYDFLKHLNNLGEHRSFNWVSGKTLQSYWNNGDAKYVKINALLSFLKIPFNDWDAWLKDTGRHNGSYTPEYSRLTSSTVLSRTSMAVIKAYYVGNYFLYYQKTDASRTIIKTPFVIEEQEHGQVVIHSVSEGHRYKGKVTGIRDGCLYISNQNLDFDEMEQYVFNIGLETKPEVLFGVSTTVSVKNRQAVALKNVLVKQKTDKKDFRNIPETAISFEKKYVASTEEAIIVNFLRNCSDNIIAAPVCCTLGELKGSMADH